MKRKMPIGTDDFKDVVEQNYFVDKTRFIRELLNQHSKVTLITRPRRFGKTLMMSMLYYFFSLQHENDKALFDGLEISSDLNCMEHRGKYPVIFLSLKNLKQLRFHDTMDFLRRDEGQLFRQFPYLLESPQLDSDDKEFIKRITNEAIRDPMLADLSGSLGRLSSLLWKHHGIKPILLIDEYDAPIQQAWENGFYSEMISFMKTFLGAALKTNPALNFAVLTGVLRVAKESIFSDLNNLDVASVLSERYSDIFGFTLPEVEKLAEDAGCIDHLPEIRQWYDGYRFGTNEIYNPWSVLQYVDKDCTPRAYWVNTSGNAILKELLARVDAKRRNELQGLLLQKPLRVPVQESVIYPEIRENRDALYNILLTTGYLKSMEVEPDADGRPWCSLLIPNREIRIVYQDEILGQLAQRRGISSLFDLLEAAQNGDVEIFEDELAAIVREMVGSHDAAHPESFYHGMMLGLSVLLRDHYAIRSNRESGYGRFDLAWFPKNPEHPGVVLEFKTAEDEKELTAKAEEGL
ncbi:MAG: AAA family ATPase, partial [Selenomonadaceae bacterium]|nr:AAA family ATPase [Selenomonadaceae bacterium]